MTRLVKRILGEGSFYAAVVVLVTFAAFPFYWMLLTAFKTDADLYNLKSNPYWFNTAPTFEHIRYLFSETLFVQWVSNTVIIGICVVAITLLVALPAGYSLARMSGRGAESLGIGIFLTYLVPPTLLFLPLSRVISLLGLQDSLWSLATQPSRFHFAHGCLWVSSSRCPARSRRRLLSTAAP
jgi:multiple sugar transport system permease protein